MSDFIKRPHDTYFKKVFSKKENAILFFKNFLPEKVSKLLDFDTLTPYSTSFVTKNLKTYFSDLTYTVNLKGYQEKAYIYLLLEHKSYHDELVAFQLLKYMIRLYDEHLRTHKKIKKLPIVIPIVFYHGERELKINNKFSSLFVIKYDIFKEFIPDFPLF